MSKDKEIELLSFVIASMISIAGFLIIWFRVWLGRSENSIWPSVKSVFTNLGIFFVTAIFTKVVPYIVLFNILYSAGLIWFIHYYDECGENVRDKVFVMQVIFTVGTLLLMGLIW